MRGVFFSLYVAIDVWSRKIGGWSVRHEESGEYARNFIAGEGADPRKLVLHADNGGPMNGSTLLSTLQRLGVVPSFPKRERRQPVFGGALPDQYRPGYPRKPFESFETALRWVEGFVGWYNDEHLHNGIRYVTPSDRHALRDRPILALRHDLYIDAKRRTRVGGRVVATDAELDPVSAVYLNPIKREVRTPPLATTLS